MYEYYYRSRPPGFACQPGGFDTQSREYWCPRKYVNGIPYHGKVSYPEPLSHHDLYRYELRPVNLVEYAEHVFWQHREPGFDLRAEYLSADRALLEEYAAWPTRSSILARAALIILDAQKESENVSP